MLPSSVGAGDDTAPRSNAARGPAAPAATSNTVVGAVAVEEDDTITNVFDDVIPGPPIGLNGKLKRIPRETSLGNASTTSNSAWRGITNLGGLLNTSGGSNSGSNLNSSLWRRATTISRPIGKTAIASQESDELNLSLTEPKWAGTGILANRADLELPYEEFAAGCNLLQAAARGDIAAMDALLLSGRTHVNFRDYDRRTAMHVAASEGLVSVCDYLVKKGASINRSDRWGGSPLDDAHRHDHKDIIKFLRANGATTGSANRAVNLITAAAEGDVDEVKTLLMLSRSATGKSNLDVNKRDYDHRTALHLAASEGHLEIVEVLVGSGADVNCADRWSRQPLDEALAGKHQDVADFLIQAGAKEGLPKVKTSELDYSSQRAMDNMKVEFSELELIDKVGAGAFGEIYKCRWRGTLVAAKIIKSAKIRQEWMNRNMQRKIKNGMDVDDAIKEMDEAAEVTMDEEEKDSALADFRQEISLLRSLRHPHIVLLLAYSTTENYECLISELMKCSLLDVFKSHLVQGTRMAHRNQIVYATQLAMGMNYLHTCKPPIIHRDLKPANLLIDHSGVLKISDFGLSRVRPDPTEKETDHYVMTGETGSYRFMAPECFRHEEYNETVDVYSFAMIFFYLVVGRPPWPNLSGLAAVKRASEEGDRPNIPRDLNGRLQELMKECWDENPSKRPPFSRIVDELNRYTYEAFKVDSNNVISISSETNGCGCTIL